jgi:hypothetical protein
MFAFKCDHEKCYRCLYLYLRFLLIEIEIHSILKSNLILSIEFTVNPIELFEEKKRFLIYIIFTLTINDEIDLHLTSLLLVICILCREGFLFNNNNNTITKDKVPKESSLFDSNFQLLNCTMIKTKKKRKYIH